MGEVIDINDYRRFRRHAKESQSRQPYPSEPCVSYAQEAMANSHELLYRTLSEANNFAEALDRRTNFQSLAAGVLGAALLFELMSLLYK